MCIHRILRAEFGESLIISYEPNGRHLPSSDELLRVAAGLPMPANQFQFRPSQLPSFHKEQGGRWRNRMPMTRIPRDCCSPQSSRIREQTSATQDRRDERMQRHKHQRTLGRYEEIIPASTYTWNGVQCTSEEVRLERKITKTSWARSAGKHGGKPRYKDRNLRAAGSGKTRAANAIW